MFSKDSFNSTATFAVMVMADGQLTPATFLNGDIAIHLEFVSYTDTK
jgi:hypothetical protein